MFRLGLYARLGRGRLALILDPWTPAGKTLNGKLGGGGDRGGSLKHACGWHIPRSNRPFSSPEVQEPLLSGGARMPPHTVGIERGGEGKTGGRCCIRVIMVAIRVVHPGQAYLGLCVSRTTLLCPFPPTFQLTVKWHPISGHAVVVNYFPRLLLPFMYSLASRIDPPWTLIIVSDPSRPILYTIIAKMLFINPWNPNLIHFRCCMPDVNGKCYPLSLRGVG